MLRLSNEVKKYQAISIEIVQLSPLRKWNFQKMAYFTLQITTLFFDPKNLRNSLQNLPPRLIQALETKEKTFLADFSSSLDAPSPFKLIK